jgi:hypothetical protein
MNGCNRELMVFDGIESAYTFVAELPEGVESKEDVQTELQRNEHFANPPRRVAGLQLVLNRLALSTRGAPQKPVIISNDEVLPYPWSRKRALSSKLNTHPSNAGAEVVSMPWYVRTFPAFSQSPRRAGA